MGSLVQIQSPRPFLSSMPALLLTNDDGVHAAGLAALEQALAELGDAYVLAPEREQSACGHALTLHRPLRVDRLGERRFGVNGTPSDCVDLGVAAEVARLIALRVLVTGLPPKTLLNVNVPGEPPRGIRLTRLGHRVYRGKIVEQADPRGRPHYWIGAGEPEWEGLQGTDMGALHEGYVSITPLHLDLTNHRAFDQLADFSRSLDAQYRPATRKRARSE